MWDLDGEFCEVIIFEFEWNFVIEEKVVKLDVLFYLIE